MVTKMVTFTLNVIQIYKFPDLKCRLLRLSQEYQQYFLSGFMQFTRVIFFILKIGKLRIRGQITSLLYSMDHKSDCGST